jgi:RNA polymerase sigma-70 factor (ECF subfamily)
MEASELEPLAAMDAANSAAAFSRALAALSDSEMLRLHALARLRARGLPHDISWSDLLHEAIARALDGSRQWPAGLPILAFIAGVMRSLCDEIWRQRRREAALIVRDEAKHLEVACPAPDQERVLVAAEAVTAIYRLFAGDDCALRILAGLTTGQSADEIRSSNNLSPVEYDSARRRMRRALIRAGLSWSTP